MNYRILRVNAHGITEVVRIVRLKDDPEAVRYARALSQGYQTEIWCGDCCIAVLPRGETGSR